MIARFTGLFVLLFGGATLFGCIVERCEYNPSDLTVEAVDASAEASP